MGINFLIVDGYPKNSRDKFQAVGMRLGGELYRDLLLKYIPNAQHKILFTSDTEVQIPGKSFIKDFNGILWPGCNLTVYDKEDERVEKMLSIAELGYELGVPQFGSCWGAQIAVYVAGGKIEAHPLGREMGIARKIYLTELGRSHPMYKGKLKTFDAYISHDDEITRVPHNTKVLSGNAYCAIQSVAVSYKKGNFWGVQYHPEYNLFELSRLILAREEKLIGLEFFKNEKDLKSYCQHLEDLYFEPNRKDLRWKLGIDDDVLDSTQRELEFKNWIDQEFLHIG